MKAIPRILGSLALLVWMPCVAAQAVVVRKHLDSVSEHVASQAMLAAARSLHAAHVEFDELAAGAERDELAVEIAALVAKIDPLLPRRRALERDLAQQFVTISTRLADAELPRTAKLVVDDAARLDRLLVASTVEKVRDAVARSNAGAGMGQRDAAFVMAFSLAQKLAPVDKRDPRAEMAKKGKALHKDIGGWLKLRVAATRQLRAVASAYLSQAQPELGLELAAIGYEFDPDGIRKVYDKLRVAAEESRVERRYQRFAKVHMDELRNHNQKLGGSKGWRLGARVFDAPKASTKTAILVSDKQLTGDYRIEVDVQFESIRGVMQVVLAWRSEDDYCVLEFERPRASYSLLRIVHVQKGAREVIAETRAKQTMRDYVTLLGEVRKGRIKVGVGRTRTAADSPIKTDAGVCFGLIRPALDRKPKKAEKNAVVRLRNLVITEL